MSRRAEYHLVARFVVTAEQVEAVRAVCSPSGRFTWVSYGAPGNRTQEKLRINTLRGVPGKHIDVLIPDCVISDYPLVCEIGRKAGCYDGALRWRLTFRLWPTPTRDENRPSLQFPGRGKIIIDEDIDCTVLMAHWTPIGPEDSGAWAHRFPRLRYTIDERTDLLAIFMGQAKGWFRFLFPTWEEDVRAAGALWATLEHTKACQDIVVLNRTASACLYDLATQLGWRKLTLREKRGHGLADDSFPWVRQDAMVMRQGRVSSVSVAGEYTERAANGDREYIRTAHGIVDVE